jgi:hypothetical protein
MSNWHNTLIRCSSLGNIMTEPKDKASKAAGELSKTAKTHLKSIYILEKYGRDKELKSKPIAKGIEVEEESITLLARVMKRMLYKNDQRLSNEFITGLPDIFDGKTILESNFIIDIKSSYDLHSFIANVAEPLDRDYYYQLQGYMALSGAPKAYIAYCLVDTPANIIEGEKFKLLRSMDVVSEDSPEFIAEAMRIEKNMTFGDIPKEERVLLFQVERNDEIISNMYSMVVKAREYLQQLEDMHLSFNKQILSEI